MNFKALAPREPDGSRKRILHVYPVDDLIDHETDGATPCPCAPRREERSGWVLYVHDALDGRK